MEENNRRNDLLSFHDFTIKIRIYDRRLKMIPVLLINNRRSKRTTASPFTFRQLISHRRFRDISLSLPFLLARVSLN